MPGPSTAAAPLFVKSHRADWPLPPLLPEETRPSPPSSRDVQTCQRSLPCRRGLPRGGRSGQKLSGLSWFSPSWEVAAAVRRLAKTRLARTAPAQLALPASPSYCTELRPSQGRTLGQNKLTKCRRGTNWTRVPKSQPRQCPKPYHMIGVWQCKEAEGWVRMAVGGVCSRSWWKACSSRTGRRPGALLQLLHPARLSRNPCKLPR